MRKTLMPAIGLAAALRSLPGKVVPDAVATRRRWPALGMAAVVGLLTPLVQAGAARASWGFAGNFYANIRDPYTNTCVNVRNDSTQAGAPVQVYACDGTGASDFYFAGNGIDHGLWEIIGERSNLCLTPSGSDPHNTTPVVQWYCTGAQSQQWELIPVNGGFWIVNLANHLCLTEPDANEWTIMQLWTCGWYGGAYQTFQPDHILPA